MKNNNKGKCGHARCAGGNGCLQKGEYMQKYEPDYIVTWGKDHSKTFETYTEAKDFAHQQGFYFTVYINGTVFNRTF